MNKDYIKKIGLSGLFITIGLILPFITGQIPKVGNMLLPMHIPVLLCGFLCGARYGIVVGFILPLVRSVIFGIPVLFPSAVAMSAELATYGLVVGLIYYGLKKKNIVSLYISLLAAMVSGRLVWGAMQIILLGISGGNFTWQTFIMGALINAIPGIILQLILIPAIMIRLNGSKWSLP